MDPKRKEDCEDTQKFPPGYLEEVLSSVPPECADAPVPEIPALRPLPDNYGDVIVLDDDGEID